MGRVTLEISAGPGLRTGSTFLLSLSNIHDLFILKKAAENERMEAKFQKRGSQTPNVAEALRTVIL